MKKITLNFLPIILISLFIYSCEEAEDEDSDATTMCYVIGSDNSITLNCYTDEIHACEDDGRTSLGTYDSWDQCFEDFDAVLENWRNGILEPGPNSNENGGSNGSSGGGNSGGGNSGGTDCDLTNYNGPTSDFNLRAFCEAAYVYDCTGNQQGLDETCAIYEGYRDFWTGPDPFPECPYCI